VYLSDVGRIVHAVEYDHTASIEVSVIVSPSFFLGL
jgi:hypothetical protein